MVVDGVIGKLQSDSLSLSCSLLVWLGRETVVSKNQLAGAYLPVSYFLEQKLDRVF